MRIRAEWILQTDVLVFEKGDQCHARDESTNVGTKGHPTLTKGTDLFSAKNPGNKSVPFSLYQINHSRPVARINL